MSQLCFDHRLKSNSSSSSSFSMSTASKASVDENSAIANGAVNVVVYFNIAPTDNVILITSTPKASLKSHSQSSNSSSSSSQNIQHKKQLHVNPASAFKILLIQYFPESSSEINQLDLVQHKPRFALNNDKSILNFRVHLTLSFETHTSLSKIITKDHSLVSLQQSRPVILRGFISGLPTNLQESEIVSRLSAIIPSIKIKLHLNSTNDSKGTAFFSILKNDRKLFLKIQSTTLNRHVKIQFYKPKAATCSKCFQDHKTSQCTQTHKCCFKCRSYDHTSDQCQLNDASDRKCLKCNALDHYVIRCPQFLNQLNGDAIDTSANPIIAPTFSASSFPSLTSRNHTTVSPVLPSVSYAEVVSIRNEMSQMKIAHELLLAEVQGLRSEIRQLLTQQKPSSASSKTNSRKTVSTPTQPLVVTPSQTQETKRNRSSSRSKVRNNYIQLNSEGFANSETEITGTALFPVNKSSKKSSLSLSSAQSNTPSPVSNTSSSSSSTSSNNT